jgi:hypothetical protein
MRSRNVRFRFVLLSALVHIAACGGSHAQPSAEADAGRSQEPNVILEAEASQQANQVTDASNCVIDVANYDQSCSVDTDCISGLIGSWPIQSGNYCEPKCYCGDDAISKAAVDQYLHDVKMTPWGSGAFSLPCSCLEGLSPCCLGGKCTTARCPSPRSSAPPHVPDAGATSHAGAVPPGSVMCGLHEGPFDAGNDAGEPWRWCSPPEGCVPFNGGWACCVGSESNVPAVCSIPLVNDGGR